MRYASLLSVFIFLACGTSPPATRSQSQPQNASVTAPKEFLLASAANDFQIHRPPYPVRFRRVRMGYLMTAEGLRQYLLCGEFLPAQNSGKAEWTAFVTIKTSGYEQWLGSQAVPFCGNPSITWVEGHLSSALQRHLDSRK